MKDLLEINIYGRKNHCFGSFFAFTALFHMVWLLTAVTIFLRRKVTRHYNPNSPGPVLVTAADTLTPAACPRPPPPLAVPTVGPLVAVAAAAAVVVVVAAVGAATDHAPP